MFEFLKRNFAEFKTFAMRGNVIDMAVGIIIGAAFGKVVDSMVKDVIMPPLGWLMGKVDFTNLYLSLPNSKGEIVSYPSLEAAKAAGAAQGERLSKYCSGGRWKRGGLCLFFCPGRKGLWVPGAASCGESGKGACFKDGF